MHQWILISLLTASASAKVFTNPAQLTKSTYDYIIVGGGLAGGVVAARLTENPSVSVLVLEAGVTNDGVTAAIVPFLAPTLTPNTLYDWNYTTTAQTSLNNRVVAYPRGRILGGSSTVNYLVYGHGSDDDWNRYAAVTGDPGWNWKNMEKYLLRHEKVVAPADHHNTTGQFTPAKHGFHGEFPVSLAGFPSVLDPHVIAATQELPDEFPFNQDNSGGNVVGISWAFAAIGKGVRSSSATTYLHSAITRPNLDVVINAQVTKLVQTNSPSSAVPAFKAVLVTSSDDTGAPVKQIKANQEVVLSAGSIGSIILLQLSGIGDKSDLSTLGIKTIVNNPSVGKNLSDHILQPNNFVVNTSATYDDILRNTTVFDEVLNRWNTTRTGPFAGGLANHIAWLRLPSNASIFKTVKDPSAGPHSSHYEFIFTNLWNHPGVAQPATGHFIGIASCLISPTSRGTVKITSTDPFAKPLIDPNFLSTQFDVFATVESVKAAKRFAATNAFKGFVTGPFGDLGTATTDAEIEAYVRASAETVFHPTGTAMMSPKGAHWGVVDPDLKVKGVQGLRIVDASIYPFIPNAHTGGPTYLIAERGADLIKNDFVKGNHA